MSIAVETRNGVAHIGIARPEKKNAITVAMYQALADAIAAGHGESGLPLGLQVVARPGNDARALAAAAWIESQLAAY